VAILVACLQNRKVSFEEKLSIMGRGVGNKDIITMLIIFLEAGAFVGVVGRSGVQSVYLCCPGFASDCLETLYDIPNEIEPAYRAAYREAHPDAPEPSFTYVPCLDPHVVYPGILHHVLKERSEFLRGLL
jgi:hypothetical protein